MISRNAKQGFFAAHWDWLVAIVGLIALLGAGVFAVLAFGEKPEDSAAATVAEFRPRNQSGAVAPVEMQPYQAAKKAIEAPGKLPEPAHHQESYLGSGRRIACEQGEEGKARSCGMPIPEDCKVCPFCGAKQPEEKKIVYDTDSDGMPDEYEKKFGLNLEKDDRFEDLDGDGFTNWEEFQAGTDPSDAKSHRDYLDSLRLELPLMETVMPFYFKSATKTPAGMRFYFFDPVKKNDYGKKGTTYSVLEGEEIGKSGFVAKGYEHKSEKRQIKGGGGAAKEIDCSVATVVRKEDGKIVKMGVDEKKKSVDVQAKLVYTRGGTKEFIVVPNNVIELNGTKYKVIAIERTQKGAKVTVEHTVNGKQRTLDALEQ